MGSGLFGTFSAVALGVLWWSQMLRKLPADLRTLRESCEPAEKAVVVILWIFSGLIALWLLGTVIGTVRGLWFVLR